MNDSLFTEGITHFMLIDQQGNVLSERLVFVPDRKTPQWQITPDRPTYGKEKSIIKYFNKRRQGKSCKR